MLRPLDHTNGPGFTASASILALRRCLLHLATSLTFARSAKRRTLNSSTPQKKPSKGETSAKAPALPEGSDQPTRYAEQQGEGGETHQTATGSHDTMTTQQGVPVADDQNSLKAGPRGPTLLEDFILREKIFHFDHERIPERVVHARGYGAHGVFELTDSLADYTQADVLSTVGQQTEVFVRFSTVAGNKGSADLPRDVRGFAVKFGFVA